MVEKSGCDPHQPAGTVYVLLLRATEYGNRGWLGADARAGRTPTILAGRPKGRSKEHFSLSETDARAARLAVERLLEPDLALALPDDFLDRAEAFVGLLLAANRRSNLTRVVEPEAMARLHLLDALAALPLIDAVAPATAVDLGSGGGVPGLVLALARPDVRWTLVESVAKKARALRSFVDALRLRQVEVLAERAELMGRDAEHRAASDLVTARACAPLPVLVEYALPLLRVGGTLLAWKGPIGRDELDAGAAAARLLGGGWPSVQPSGFAALGGHQFVLVGKEGATSGRYPRRAGQPGRRPLG
jgi:16S rRNA (guanine527-N7)-methyltransferase